MIIDSEAYPVSNEIRFFGLKKNGRFYFKELNNKKTAYFSMNVENDNKGIIGGESFFIKISSNDNNIQVENYYVLFQKIILNYMI